VTTIGNQFLSFRDIANVSHIGADGTEVRGSGCSERSKAHKYATEFEAILVSSLLEKMEQTVQTLPGDDADAGHDNFQSLGVQAVGKAIAEGGGFGIAKMIEQHLTPGCASEGITEVTSEPLKSRTTLADERRSAANAGTQY